MENNSYSPPLSLEVISGVFLALGAIHAIVIAADIIHRRGWQSMMWIMIPVYIVNATYLGPLALFAYFRYGRAAKPGTAAAAGGHCHSHAAKQVQGCHSSVDTEKQLDEKHNATAHCKGPQAETVPSHSCHKSQMRRHSDSTQNDSSSNDVLEEKAQSIPAHPEGHKNQEEHHHDHHTDAARPMWATVLVGICHCGAGCVLGDLVGEWIVYGSDWMLGGAHIWSELILDYIFALAFGVLFQYFSIAPMSGEYGLRTVWRAIKADFLSLTSFQVGLFAWMIAYQVGIFQYDLEMTTWTYWWLMQVGMVFGTVTAFPMNWWLIGKGIKEPCC